MVSALLAFSWLAPVARADVLNQQVIYDQDPWDPNSRLEVGDCSTAPDGAVTCDTRPSGQVWVESTITGD